MTEDKRNKENVLVDVSLASEASHHDDSRDVALGVVAVTNLDNTINELRNALFDQLGTLPQPFAFLSYKGWPITKEQEFDITISQVLCSRNLIRIYRCFDRPRVGVRSVNGKALGFVFIDHTEPLTHLRSSIQQQICLEGERAGWQTYHFMDRNEWPITHEQESSLVVTDILVNAAVILRPLTLPAVTHDLDHEINLSQGSIDEVDAIQKPNKRPRLGLKQLTFKTSKDQQRQISREESVTFIPKQILISYVRAEAAQHAIDLKMKLLELGCTSVYLDVHEIKSGVDWADSLNYAVSNCEVFVPLITSRYGETQWTNREVKLADMLSKYIVPVSFLEFWPPRCLAIQFATTQFIPWSSTAIITMDDSSEKDTMTEPCNWNAQQVSDVATTILNRVKVQQQERATPKLHKQPKLRSCPSKLPGEFSMLSQNREGRTLVVISVHPKQAKLGTKLKQFFESKNYEVWCSSELCKSIEGKDITGCDRDLNLSPDEGADKTESDPELCLSQLSQLSMSPDRSDPRKADLRAAYQAKIDDAGVVIMVLSKAFAKSKTCRMQVFYCEQRKRVIPLKYEDFCMPSWMSTLIGTGFFQDMLVDYETLLYDRVEKAMRGEDILENEDEEYINSQVRKLKKEIPHGINVYISGGTKFYHNQTRHICRLLGERLAGIDGISLVTGGFYGVGQEISQSYHNERSRHNKSDSLWHVLPTAGEKDMSYAARQNDDGTFLPVPYGQSCYYGNTVRQREKIVARAFDICILIEGGPGAAHEAEQFSWAGHAVVPISTTGGAAAGKFNVPNKIFEVPCGVLPQKWSMLSNKSSSPVEIADAMYDIISVLQHRLRMDSPSVCDKKIQSFTQLHKSPRKHRKRTTISTARTTIIPEDQGTENPSSPTL